MAGPPEATGAETVEAALARLGALHPKKIDLSLDRIEQLLDALGRPQDRLPPVVHIAGTNGKGSTAAFLAAISEAAGERVHVYTSPHLVRFNERIRLAGEIVDNARLTDAFLRCEAANAGRPITFFEITTAAALLLFAETPAERVILETGLGGRFDATNVLPNPAATIVTPVSFDHQAFLGGTLAEIAAEKAGIVKPGVPLVIGPQAPDALHVIERAAMKLSAPVSIWGEHFRAYLEHDRLIYEEEDLLWDLPKPRLPGAHQVANAGAAIAAARLLGLPETAARKGVAEARWPARLQRIASGPLQAIAKSGDAELWLDGGHNIAAGEAVASAMGEMEARNARPLVLIAAFSKNKDARAYFDAFEGLAARVIAVTFQGGREGAQSAQDVADAARAADIPAQTASSLDAALFDALEDHHQPRILICGSLYLAGEALARGGGAAVQVTPG